MPEAVLRSWSRQDVTGVSVESFPATVTTGVPTLACQMQIHRARSSKLPRTHLVPTPRCDPAPPPGPQESWGYCIGFLLELAWAFTCTVTYCPLRVSTGCIPFPASPCAHDWRNGQRTQNLITPYLAFWPRRGCAPPYNGDEARFTPFFSLSGLRHLALGAHPAIVTTGLTP